MPTSLDIFNKLPGLWSFNRTLDNTKEPQLSGVAKGCASFEPVPGEKDFLHYKESGIFNSCGGTQFQFFKEYLFVFNQYTQKIEKHFAQDGVKIGLFYTFDACYTGNHICVKDQYKASYEFPNDDFQEFSLTYTVTGPKKNYVSKTTYELI